MKNIKFYINIKVTTWYGEQPLKINKWIDKSEEFNTTGEHAGSFLTKIRFHKKYEWKDKKS